MIVSFSIKGNVAAFSDHSITAKKVLKFWSQGAEKVPERQFRFPAFADAEVAGKRQQQRQREQISGVITQKGCRTRKSEASGSGCGRSGRPEAVLVAQKHSDVQVLVEA